MGGPALPGDLDPTRFDAAVELLASLAGVSSPSTDAGGLHRFARRLEEELAARALEVRTESFRSGDEHEIPLLVANSRSGGGRPLLLLGHFDTVLPAAEPRRAGDRLFATGAIDMKGGIATLLAALDLLAARGLSPPDDLRLVLVPDEEIAGPVSRRATAEHGADARAVWVLEPGEPRPGDRETIVVGRRGLESFRLEIVGRAAHSGLHFWNGRSAIAAAAEWTSAAAARSRPAGGPTVNIARFVGGDAGFVDHLAERAGLLGGDAQLNVVPDRAVVEGEYRYLRSEDGRALAASLAAEADALAARRDVAARLAFFGTVPPVEPSPARRAEANRVVTIATERGWSLEVEDDRGGISFPNFLPAGAEIPVIDGLGPIGGGMHTRDEFVDLRSYARRIVLLADLLAAETTADG